MNVEESSGVSITLIHLVHLLLEGIFSVDSLPPPPPMITTSSLLRGWGGGGFKILVSIVYWWAGVKRKDPSLVPILLTLSRYSKMETFMQVPFPAFWKYDITNYGSFLSSVADAKKA